MKWDFLAGLVATLTMGAAWTQTGPIGWASVNAEAQNGTTGGALGKTVTVTTAAELEANAISPDPMIIRISGTIKLAVLRPASDKTIEGAGPGATFEGSLLIKGSSTAPLKNIIIRNLIIRALQGGIDGDGISVRYSHHIWIDHCDVSDSPDGLIDITNATNYATVSWTKIWYSRSTGLHRFPMLIGASDTSAAMDSDKLKITLHHNWWADNVVERMPRARFGQIHVFNNYYSSKGNSYAIGAGVGARMVIDNNYFDGVKNSHIFYDNEKTAQIVANGNVYIGIANATRKDSGQGKAFVPPYAYTLETTIDVKKSVLEGAGPSFKIVKGGPAGIILRRQASNGEFRMRIGTENGNWAEGVLDFQGRQLQSSHLATPWISRHKNMSSPTLEFDLQSKD